MLTKTTLFQLDLLLMILTSKILKLMPLKLPKAEKLQENRSEKDSQILIEIYQTQKLTIKLTMLDSFSVNYASDRSKHI